MLSRRRRVQAGPDRVSVRVGGEFTSEEDLRAINIRVNDRFFRLSDIAIITRGYEDPPLRLFRFDGKAGDRPGYRHGPTATSCIRRGAQRKMDTDVADMPLVLACIWSRISQLS